VLNLQTISAHVK